MVISTKMKKGRQGQKQMGKENVRKVVKDSL